VIPITQVPVHFDFVPVLHFWPSNPFDLYPAVLVFDKIVHFPQELIDRISSTLELASAQISLERLHLTVFTPTRLITPGEFCWHQTFMSWRIHLLQPETLPELQLVQSLTVENGAELSPTNAWLQQPSVHKIDWRAIVVIAAKLPPLEILECRIGGDEWPSTLDDLGSHYAHDWEGPRRESRRDFTEALAKLILPSLRQIDMDFISPYSQAKSLDHRKAFANLVLPHQYDMLSSGLRLLSYLLRRMNLRGVFDLTLLWPVDDTTSPPLSPCLKSLIVVFDPSMPTGAWYFKGLRNESGATEGFEVTEVHYPPLTKTTEDEDMDERADEYPWDVVTAAKFRVVPDDVTLVPLIRAFGKAMGSSMPALKEAVLWSPLEIRASNISPFYEDCTGQELVHRGKPILYELAWSLAYTAPNVKHVIYCEESLSVRALWWWTGHRWRPDTDLRALFQKVGSDQHGEGLSIIGAIKIYGNGIMHLPILEGRFGA